MTKASVQLKRIRNADDLVLGVAQLEQIDPRLWTVAKALEEIPLRLRKPGFEGLADIVTAQMVSRASATAIFGRLTSLINPFDADTFLKAGEAPLVEAGLSRAKQKTLTGLAQALSNDEIDLEALCTRPVEDAHKFLTALSGIGPWTAEVFLLFCAGHADIFPAGDIALQHAAADVLGLPERPDTKTTAKLAQQWAPVRGVAARILYAHYAVLKRRSSLPV